MGILRLGYLEIRVKEINKAAQYYTQVLGLKETARAAGKIYLKAWDEWEHHQLVLVEDPSPGLNHMAFRLESLDDLPFFENKLERNGCRVERVAGADKYELGEAIRFTAPSEHRVELYYDMTIVGNGLPTTKPPPYPDDLLGIHPPRMDHTLLTTPDTPASLHFWQEVMGFPPISTNKTLWKRSVGLKYFHGSPRTWSFSLMKASWSIPRLKASSIIQISSQRISAAQLRRAGRSSSPPDMGRKISHTALSGLVE